MFLPGGAALWRTVAQIAFAATCAGVLFVYLAVVGRHAQVGASAPFEGHDEILVFVLLRLVPFLSSFAASVIAVVLVLTVRPDAAVAGVVGICTLLWLGYESATDRFLHGRLRR